MTGKRPKMLNRDPLREDEYGDPLDKPKDPLTEFPCDLEAEQSAVASLMYVPTLLNDPRAPRLFRHDFFHDPERLLFGVIEDMVTNSKPTNDPTVLYDELKKRKHFDGRSLFEVVGGAPYLGTTLNRAAEPANYRHYVDIIKEKTQLRAIKKLAAEVLVATTKESPDELIYRLENGLQSAKWAAQDGGDDFNILSCADLEDGDFDIEYIIPGVLAAKQSCIIGAPQKGMKTSTTVDLGYSLATGGYFVGYWKVAKPTPVLIMSAESGMGTLRATARSVARVAGRRLRDVELLHWCSEVPRIGDASSMRKLGRALQRIGEGGVCVIDPTYIALPAVDPANLFAQGALLQTLDKVCQEHGITCIMVHHLKKGRISQYDPPELSELSYAGFGEWARQWILMSRRERYTPPGLHRLWFSWGGSAGHSGLVGLDIDDHWIEPNKLRHWGVTVRNAEELFNESKQRGKQQKEDQKQKLLQADAKAIREYLASKLPSGDTVRGITDALKGQIPYKRVQKACVHLEEDGTVAECDVIKADRATPRPGFKLKDEEPDISGIVEEAESEPETEAA